MKFLCTKERSDMIKEFKVSLLFMYFLPLLALLSLTYLIMRSEQLVVMALNCDLRNKCT